MKRRIAFFDFDGTITTKDTLLEFIKYTAGKNSFYKGFILSSPFIIAYKLQLMSNHSAKEKVMRYFFANTSLIKFREQCVAFTEQVIPALLRQKAIKEIKKLQEAGAEVVVVSASAENWVSIWCESMQLKCLATELEICDDNISGRIRGSNCHGEEKVRRIQEAYDLSAYDEIYCYGDTKGDKPMLSLATFGFYKPFR